MNKPAATRRDLCPDPVTDLHYSQVTRLWLGQTQKLVPILSLTVVVDQFLLQHSNGPDVSGSRPGTAKAPIYLRLSFYFTVMC